MLVFSTRLPIKKEITRQECLTLFLKWIKESPHYQIDKLDFDVNSFDDYDYIQDNITFSFRHFKDESIELSACRFENREPNAVWDNDCIFLNDCIQGKKSLLIQLNCNLTDFRADLPNIHKPYLVRMFVEQGYCDLDGKIPVTDEPIVASEDNYEEYRDIMCGNFPFEMPVVYISKDYRGNALINVQHLAHQLSGVAHVFVEKSYDIAVRLQKDTNGNNAYLGYAGIYFPRTSYCQKHGLDYYENDDKKMFRGIIDDVWDSLLNRSDSSQYNWNQILALQARQKMLEMKDFGEKNKLELDAYIETFDEERRELSEKVDKLNRQVLSLRSERDGLIEAKEKATHNKLFYKMGSENELYNGECNDLLYSVLTKVLKNFGENTRPYCIIRSLLDANPKVGNCEKLLNGVKDVFNTYDRMSNSKKRQLQELGFTIQEDGSHYKIIFKDPRYMFTVSKTPSDYRGCKNLISEICKMLDIDKKISF